MGCWPVILMSRCCASACRCVQTLPEPHGFRRCDGAADDRDGPSQMRDENPAGKTESNHEFIIRWPTGLTQKGAVCKAPTLGSGAEGCISSVPPPPVRTGGSQPSPSTRSGQPGGLPDGSRGSRLAATPGLRPKGACTPERGARTLHTWRRRPSGIPPGCTPTLPPNRGSRCGSTPGYHLSSLRDEFLGHGHSPSLMARMVVLTRMHPPPMPIAGLTSISALVVPLGMTKSVTVSVKIPARILEHIPPPGHGRSGFIVRAIEEKLARKETAPWEPTTACGRRLAALLEKGKHERGPDLTLEELEAEIRERRGGVRW